jgi:hypothetical protein
MIDIKDIKDISIVGDNHDKIDEPEYHICCSRTSKEFIKYMGMFFISISIMIFSMCQIAIHPLDPNVIYFSMISSILTLFIPAPTLGDNKNK